MKDMETKLNQLDSLMNLITDKSVAPTPVPDPDPVPDPKAKVAKVTKDVIDESIEMGNK